MTLFIGVDLGKEGGIAVIDSHAYTLDIGEPLPMVMHLIPMPLENIYTSEDEIAETVVNEEAIIKILRDVSTTTKKGSNYFQPCELIMEQINVYSNSNLNIQSTSQLFIQHGFFRALAKTFNMGLTVVHPRTWQSEMGCLPLQGKARRKETAGMNLEEAKEYEKEFGSKGLALREAKKRFPGVRLIPDGKRVPHDGIVDALLLAEFGRIMKGKHKEICYEPTSPPAA